MVGFGRFYFVTPSVIPDLDIEGEGHPAGVTLWEAVSLLSRQPAPE
jgi:hypothetical protein